MEKKVKITIRQLPEPQPAQLTWPEFWEILAHLPKFKKIGRFTIIDV